MIPRKSSGSARGAGAAPLHQPDHHGDQESETTDHQAPQGTQKESPAAAASIQRREIFPATQKYLPLEGRRLTPEDMKQESLPPKQHFKPVRPRFDKNGYMRELMKKRRANRAP